jgi:hypothetical protein
MQLTIIVIPSRLAHEVHEPLRRHYRDDPSVRVVVERRAPGDTLRESRSPQNRRAGDRGHRLPSRPTILATSPPKSLPPEAAPYVDQLNIYAKLDSEATEVESLRLVARFQHGDPDAFAGLYVRHFDRVYHYLIGFLESPEQAEDVAQDVFLKAHKALYRYRFQPGASFSAWLLRVAHNKAVSALRGTRAEPLDGVHVLARGALRVLGLEGRLDVCVQRGRRGVHELRVAGFLRRPGGRAALVRGARA